MDIVNNKKQNNVEYIENSLNNLLNILIDLYDNCIPIEAIDKTYNLFVHHINSNGQEANKVKKKTPSYPYFLLKVSSYFEIAINRRGCKNSLFS